jgi:nitrogen fixation/metabolism regulation signal transduction histidine kinase
MPTVEDLVLRGMETFLSGATARNNMIIKHFRIKIITRILFLALTIYLFIYLLDVTELYATLVIVALLFVYQIYALIHQVETTNRRLTTFLEAIRHADFSQSFRGTELGKSYRQLNKAFSDVMKNFQKIRSEKEENYRYLQTVVQHVGIGLIAYDRSGKIELINTAAKRLLNISQVRHVQSLKPISEDLVKKLMKMKPRTRDLVKVQYEDDLLQLAIYTTEFRLRGRALILASIQNIQSELEEQEMEAWQKLIRVLTHEIMNSMTPISSLAKTIDEWLLEMEKGKSDKKSTDLQDIQEAIRTIQKRSDGLIHFVDSYRKLTRIPQPNFQIMKVTDLFKRVLQLMENELEKKEIKWSQSIDPEELTVVADSELIEQVLINLFKNAIDALNKTKNGEIFLAGEKDQRGRIIISLTDNGPGIVPEAREKIFMPFFTTKKTGSGIGLSLSRQIMRQHGGGITVTSNPGSETVFKLIFS